MPPVDLTVTIILSHWQLPSTWQGITINWCDCSNNFIQWATSLRLQRKCDLLIWQLQLFYFIGSFYHTWQRLPLTGLTAQIILFGWQHLSDLPLLVWLLQLFYFICIIYHAWKRLPLTDLTVQIILFGWQCLSNLEGIANCWSGGYNYFILFATYITIERNYHLLIW